MAAERVPRRVGALEEGELVARLVSPEARADRVGVPVGGLQLRDELRVLVVGALRRARLLTRRASAAQQNVIHLFDVQYTSDRLGLADRQSEEIEIRVRGEEKEKWSKR